LRFNILNWVSGLFDSEIVATGDFESLDQANTAYLLINML